MGKRKRSTQDDSARFVDVRGRAFQQLDVDLLEDDPDSVIGRCKGFALAATSKVVKLRVTHRKGDEASADRVRDHVVKAVRETAHHVYRPELVAVGDRQTRVPEMTAEVDPREAVRLWLDARPPPLHDRKSVEGELEEYINEAWSDGDARLSIKPVCVRAIRVHNFMPFERGELTDIPDGVIGVGARYEGSEGRSNRAGKSVLMEAILFVAYGEARQVRTMDDYVRRGAEEMSVDVEFDGLTVRRTRSSTGSGMLYIDGERWKIDEGNREIVKRLGMGKEDFRRICFVGQGDLHGILGEASAEFSSHIIRWLGISIWDRMCSKIRIHLAVAEKALAFKTQKQSDEQCRAKENDVCASVLDDARRGLSEAEEWLRSFKDAGASADALRERVRKSNRIRSALEAAKGREKLEQEISRLDVEVSAARVEADGERMKLGARQSEVRDCRKNAKGEFSGECPVDSMDCPRADDINGNRAPLREKLNKLEKQLKEIEGTSKVARKKFDGLDEVLNTARQDLRDVVAAERVLEDEGRNPELVDRLESLLAEVESGQRDKREADKTVEKLRDALSNLLAKEKISSTALDEVGRLEGEIHGHRGEVSMLRYLAAVTGRQGIPSMIVENSMATLEGRANEVLALMGTEHRLRFSFETELKKKATSCPDCGAQFEKGKRKCVGCGAERGQAKAERLEVRVSDGGEDLSFDLDSGGGKALLALAVRIALARMFGAVMMATDEICAPLDQENLRRLLTTLNELPTMGVDQVFVISHRPEVADALGKNILVTRYPEEARSEFGWE